MSKLYRVIVETEIVVAAVDEDEAKRFAEAAMGHGDFEEDSHRIGMSVEELDHVPEHWAGCLPWQFQRNTEGFLEDADSELTCEDVLAGKQQPKRGPKR